MSSYAVYKATGLIPPVAGASEENVALDIKGLEQVAQMIYERYSKRRLEEVEIPQVQIQRDELNMRATQFAVEAALKDARFRELEQPLGEAQRQKLMSEISDTAWQQSFQNRQLDIEESLKRGGMTLEAARQVADEAIKRDAMAVDAYKSAEQMDMARGAQAQEGYLAADKATLDRERFSAFDLAGRSEDQIIEREKFGVDTAERSARLGLDVAKENANLRGPRNAFQQQAFNFGVNQGGLSRAVDALKGAPGVTAYQAPGADAERATVGTIADDIRMSGPGQPGESSFDLMARSARQNVNNPIGVGTSMMLDVADRYAYDPYTANIQRVMQIADQDLGNRQGDMYNRVADFGDKQQRQAYNSPTAQIGMEVAGKNVGEAGPIPMSQMVQGSGAALHQTYKDLLAKTGEASIDWNDPRLVRMYMAQTGMGQAEALEMTQMASDFYKATGYPIPPERLEWAITERRAQTKANSYDTDAGAAGRTADAYGNHIRSNWDPTGEKNHLSANNADLINIYKNVAGTGQDAARLAAQRAADYYKSSGQPIPTAFQAANIGDAKAAYPSRWADKDLPEVKGRVPGDTRPAKKSPFAAPTSDGMTDDTAPDFMKQYAKGLKSNTAFKLKVA